MKFVYVKMLTVLLVACGLLKTAPNARAESSDKPSILVVVGAPGDTSYGERFDAWADGWQQLATSLEAPCQEIGRTPGSAAPGPFGNPGISGALATPQTSGTSGAPNTSGGGGDDRERLRLAIQAAIEGPGQSPLWVVLIGHGTFNGKVAKFNLVGPDVSEAELAAWLKACKRPLVVINATASSSPFLPALSGPNRVVITATRSGNQKNATYFMAAFVEALQGLAADLDKDDQVSLLEAFLMGSKQTDAFYEGQSRLVAEFALIDDNGDGLGTEAQFYDGTRAVRAPKAQRGQKPAGLDGQQAHQVHLVPSDFEASIPADLKAQRDAIEREVYRLRELVGDRGTNSTDHQALEDQLITLAKVYALIEERIGSSGEGDQPD